MKINCCITFALIYTNVSIFVFRWFGLIESKIRHLNNNLVRCFETFFIRRHVLAFSLERIFLKLKLILMDLFFSVSAGTR
jgi:hypothetical protein